MAEQIYPKGTRVRYIPGFSYKDYGVVKGYEPKHDTYFVVYDTSDERMVTGDEDYTAQATYADDLVELPWWE